MDFFQAQDDAHRKTKRLVFYFLVAVLLIVLAVYFAVTAGFLAYHTWAYQNGSGYSALEWVPLWDAKRFIITAAAVVLLIGTGSLFKVLALRGGGAVVAASLGGERVDRSTRDPARRQLLNVVEEMAIASGVPVPGVFVLVHEPAINAFAAGWGMDDAVIAVSAGALQRLSRDELQGVVAHEYSHILHGDCRLNIRLMGILFGIMMLTVFGRMIGSVLRGGGSDRRGGTVIYAGGGRRRGSNGKGGGGALILAVILVIVLVTVIGYIGTFFGRLIQAAISRQREFLADASAVQFTRNPEGIAGALKRIAVEGEHGVMYHPKASEAAHMFFADGLKRSFSSALATHPLLSDRIRTIQPDWDGSFPKRRKRRSVMDGSEPKPSAGARQDSGKKMIEAMTILGAVGTMGAGSLSKGRALRDAIPVPLDIRMRQPEGARQVILALVIADNEADDARQMEILGESFAQGECAEVRECLSLIRGLSREVRLGVLELATTTLRQSALSERDFLIAMIDSLVRADERLSLYEFCVRRILRERLRGQPASGAATAVSYMRLDPELALAVGNLLSVVAREASGTADPEDIFARALRGQYLLKDGVGYEKAEDGGIDALDLSLDRLNAAAYAIRAQCLRAVVACIQDDGCLTPEEAELVRAISLSLACPMPPLGS